MSQLERIMRSFGTLSIVVWSPNRNETRSCLEPSPEINAFCTLCDVGCSTFSTFFPINTSLRITPCAFSNRFATSGICSIDHSQSDKSQRCATGITFCLYHAATSAGLLSATTDAMTTEHLPLPRGFPLSTTPAHRFYADMALLMPGRSEERRLGIEL